MGIFALQGGEDLNGQVLVAVDEAGSFANFRETATKTNSLIDRLKAIERFNADAIRF